MTPDPALSRRWDDQFGDELLPIFIGLLSLLTSTAVWA
jgi:hypothetical protein